MIIAIDGPAGSGKSTTAKAVARRLGGLYLDTGAMYRAVALAFVRAERPATPEAARALLPGIEVGIRHVHGEMRVLLGGEDVSAEIRTERVGQMASAVARLPEVREKLVAEQRRIGRSQSEAGAHVVLDGRDVGTHVFPDADLKIFMAADARRRAERRAAELEARGEAADVEQVRAALEARDAQDRARDHAPLARAPDALDLDTTDCTVDEQVQFVVDRVQERAGG